MYKTTRQHLLAEMELVRGLMKLSPEERRKECTRQMYKDLKAMEMERRQRVARERLEKIKRDKEERETVTESRRRQRDEKKQMGEVVVEKMKQRQLKKERLRGNEMMMVEKIKRPSYTLSALKKEYERSREEAKLCCLPAVGDKADPESRASYRTSAGGKIKLLDNKWVSEEISDPVEKKISTNSPIYQLKRTASLKKSPKHTTGELMKDRTDHL